MFALLTAAIVMAAAISDAGPGLPFEIDEFIDGRDGTATLIVTCQPSKHQVSITFKRARLDRIKINDLYDFLEETCAKANSK